MGATVRSLNRLHDDDDDDDRDNDHCGGACAGVAEHVEAEWDYLTISKITYNYDDKRTHKIAEKTGRRLLVGAWKHHDDGDGDDE
jgi:hypothetical protein